VNQFIAKRREHWKFIFDGLKTSPLLKEHLIPIEATPRTNPSWFGFPMHCGPSINRALLVRFLEDHKIGSRLIFAGNLTKQPAYKNVEFRVHGELKSTDLVMNKSFWISVNPSLNEIKINYMLEQLEAGVRAQLN